MGGVVIAADHDDRQVEAGQLIQGIVEQAHSVQAGDGTVIDVPCYQDRLNLLISCRVVHVCKEGILGVDQVCLVEPAAQVPVRGVQEPHGHRP